MPTAAASNRSKQRGAARRHVLALSEARRVSAATEASDAASFARRHLRDHRRPKAKAQAELVGREYFSDDGFQHAAIQR